MFAAKKLISAFLLPLPLLVAVAAVGLILLFWRKRPRLAKAVLLADGLMFLLLSLHPLAQAVVRPLERAYPPFLPNATESLSHLPDGSPVPKWIVVLGAGHSDEDRIPPLGRLGEAALPRLTEGIRLHRLLPGSKLVLSGGNGTVSTHARILVDAAKSLGVAAGDMVLEAGSWDTEDEARALAAMVGQDRLVLVTSACHMQRAMGLFRAAGMTSIAAPTEYLADPPPTGVWSLVRWLPDGASFVLEDRALHEYLGLLWAKLRGQYR